MENMKYIQFQIPYKLNLLLRKYAIDYEKGSREKATLFILSNFLYELYNVRENEK